MSTESEPLGAWQARSLEAANIVTQPKGLSLSLRETSVYFQVTVGVLFLPGLNPGSSVLITSSNWVCSLLQSKKCIADHLKSTHMQTKHLQVVFFFSLRCSPVSVAKKICSNTESHQWIAQKVQLVFILLGSHCDFGGATK